MSTAKAIARHLLQIKAIKLSPQKPFTWASGILSPIYCDNRVITSYPEVRRFVIDSFMEKSKNFEPFAAIAGVATGGIAHGALLADRLNLPFIYVRSKAKEHGRQNLIEGELPEGTKVLVIEDLISTGGSSLTAVEALRSGGLEVVGLIAIFTYGFEQATQAFAAAHCKMDTLTDYAVLLEEAVQTHYIQPDELQTLQQWRENPKAWGIN
ncbi:MAG: orotate phosphoribosyltransferase [Saprospiraceae bacterium]